MASSVSGQLTCDAEGINCMADEVTTSDSGLDHIDALGYSGAAFRIHSLVREVVCPSTVSPRFGFTPQVIDQRPAGVVPALSLARMLAEAGQFGEYASGTAAYNLWIALLDAEESSDMYRDQVAAHTEDSGVVAMNRYCLLSLVHARDATGPFLHRRAAELTGRSAQLVADAAAWYDRVGEVLRGVGSPVWTPEGRHVEAAALREAQAAEMQAARLLAEALAVLA